MLNMGVIGYGYWGPNIVRNFSRLDNVKVISICDNNPDSARRAAKDYPHIEVISHYNDLVRSPMIDIIAIVTPVSTHYELAKKALYNGKHVFVEKPLTSTASQAEELIELSEKVNKKIAVDHTFLFSSSVRKIKELIDNDMLGNLYYYDSMRVNLGLFQHDINVIWDLAPHDFSIMDYLLKEKPAAITAHGKAHFSNGLENVAYITVYFSNDVIAHFNVNWLSPVKVRTTLIGGENRMLVWNDLEADEKIKVYDRGVEITNKEGIYNLLVKYRSGDMWTPNIDQVEALRIEAEDFVNCILNDETPVNDGYAGLRIVRMLEASNASLAKQGRLLYL